MLNSRSKTQTFVTIAVSFAFAFFWVKFCRLITDVRQKKNNDTLAKDEEKRVEMVSLSANNHHHSHNTQNSLTVFKDYEAAKERGERLPTVALSSENLRFKRDLTPEERARVEERKMVLVLFYLGLCSLLPWNTFIGALPFAQTLPVPNIGNVITVCSLVPLIFGAFVDAVFVMKTIPLLLATAAVNIGLFAFVLAESPYALLTMTVVAGLVNGALMGSASRRVMEKYGSRIQPFFAGQATSGIFTTLLSVIFYAFNLEPKVVAAVILLLGVFLETLAAILITKYLRAIVQDDDEADGAAETSEFQRRLAMLKRVDVKRVLRGLATAYAKNALPMFTLTLQFLMMTLYFPAVVADFEVNPEYLRVAPAWIHNFILMYVMCFVFGGLHAFNMLLTVENIKQHTQFTGSLLQICIYSGLGIGSVASMGYRRLL